MDKTLEEFRLRIAHAQIDSEQIEQDLWDARQRIAALEAEVERLREALKFAYCALGDLGYAYRGHAEYDAMDRIKAALEPQKGAGDG